MKSSLFHPFYQIPIWGRKLVRQIFLIQQYLASLAQNTTSPDATTVDTIKIATPQSSSSGWSKWYRAFLYVLPIYLAAHLAALFAIYLSHLFVLDTFNPTIPLPEQLWKNWFRWDSGHYLSITTFGYSSESWRTAFFPLYPLLGRVLTFFTHRPFLSLVLISNLATLCTTVVLYQLVLERFNQKIAERTVLYLSFYPAALFLMAGYADALFLCLAVLSFYHMQNKQWWWAGIFGALATLSRPSGIYIFIPFCLEYLRQHQFSIRKIRWDVLSALLLPLALGLFASYCYWRFGDFLAFSHGQSSWKRQLMPPWYGIQKSIETIRETTALTTPQAIRVLLDLVPCLAIPLLLLLSVFGPWRFPRSCWHWSLFALIIYFFILAFPVMDRFPLMAFSRNSLAIFPFFVVLASLGTSRLFHYAYFSVSAAVFVCMVAQFSLGYWVI